MDGGVVYYAKCYNVSSGTQALNSRRFAFASQLGTTEIDPQLPDINNA